MIGGLAEREAAAVEEIRRWRDGLMALRLQFRIQPVMPDEGRAGQRNGNDQDGEDQADPFVHLKPGGAEPLLPAFPHSQSFSSPEIRARSSGETFGCNLIANDYQDDKS